MKADAFYNTDVVKRASNRCISRKKNNYDRKLARENQIKISNNNSKNNEDEDAEMDTKEYIENLKNSILSENPSCGVSGDTSSTSLSSFVTAKEGSNSSVKTKNIFNSENKSRSTVSNGSSMSTDKGLSKNSLITKKNDNNEAIADTDVNQAPVADTPKTNNNKESVKKGEHEGYWGDDINGSNVGSVAVISFVVFVVAISITFLTSRYHRNRRY